MGYNLFKYMGFMIQGVITHWFQLLKVDPQIYTKRRQKNGPTFWVPFLRSNVFLFKHNSAGEYVRLKVSWNLRFNMIYVYVMQILHVWGYVSKKQNVFVQGLNG